MAMDSKRCIITYKCLHLRNDFCNFMRKRTTIGVAHHQVSSALHYCGFNNTHCKFRIIFVSIKEVFKIDHDLTAVAVQELH